MDFSKSKKMLRQQSRHPWELSRADILLSLLNRLPKEGVFADVGSGDKYYTKILTQYTSDDIYAVDKFYEQPKKLGQIIELNDMYSLPFSQIDRYLMMDFLEHIPDDDKLIEAIAKKGKKGAVCLITVPAHQFLFSAHDTNMEHYRRYSRRSLNKLLRRKGLKVERIHYFYTGLFTLRLLSYLLEKVGLVKEKETATVKWKRPPDHPITKLMRVVLDLDYLVCLMFSRVGLYLPGLSLFAYCRKV